MWLPILTSARIAFLFGLLEALTNRELERKFQLRTAGDWEREWHQERYSRCRNSIKTHLIWACEKDIYKLKRSLTSSAHFSDSDIVDSLGKNKRLQPLEKEETGILQAPWLPSNLAFQMLRTRRGRSRRSGVMSITDECCSVEGCTWEEYAEYCTQNNRKVSRK